jgi:hypothetical protein
MLKVKVNVSGSWANHCACPDDRLGAVQVACEQLASALDHGIAFNVIDCKTGEVAYQFNSRPRTGEPHGWYAADQRHRA